MFPIRKPRSSKVSAALIADKRARRHAAGFFCALFRLHPSLKRPQRACQCLLRAEHCCEGNTRLTIGFESSVESRQGAHPIDVSVMDGSIVCAFRPRTSDNEAPSACSGLLDTCRLPTVLEIVCEHTPQRAVQEAHVARTRRGLPSECSLLDHTSRSTRQACLPELLAPNAKAVDIALSSPKPRVLRPRMFGATRSRIKKASLRWL